MTIAGLALKEPPHNFGAEQAVLGAILVNNSAWSQASETLVAQHFADPLHGKLFEMAGRLIERGQVVSAFALKAYAEQDEDLQRVGGPAYLAKLMAASVHALDVPAMARTVRDCAARRGLIAALSDALPVAYVDGHELTAAEQIEAIERRLYDIAESAVEGGFQPLNSALTAAMNTAEAAHGRPGGMTGLPTGLRGLDSLLGGLNRSDLIIIAARPGMGKSGLASNIGTAASLTGATVGFFSHEMSAEQLANRIVAERAGVSAEKVRRGELTSAEFDRVLTASQELETLPF